MSSTPPSNPREQVFCHQCEHEWYRDEHGIVCPHCESEFTEIIESNDDPREDLALDEPVLPADFDRDNSPPTSTLNPDGDHDNGIHWRSTGPNQYAIRTTMRSSHDGAAQEQATPSPLSGIFGLIQNVMAGAAGPSEQTMSRNGGGTRTYQFASPAGNARFSLTTSTTVRGLPGGDAGNQGYERPMPNMTDLFQGILASPGVRTGTGGQDMHGGMPNELALLDILLHGGFGNMRPAPGYAHSQEEFDRIISDLMERTSAGSGPPAAADDAIASLPEKEITAEMLGDDATKAECTICMADVELGDTVTELYCKHWFHTDCIKIWLEQHNTCPHCRMSIEDSKRAAESKANPGSEGTSKKKRAGSSSWEHPSSVRAPPDSTGSSSSYQPPGRWARFSTHSPSVPLPNPLPNLFSRPAPQPPGPPIPRRPTPPIPRRPTPPVPRRPSHRSDSELHPRQHESSHGTSDRRVSSPTTHTLQRSRSNDIRASRRTSHSNEPHRRRGERPHEPSASNYDRRDYERRRSSVIVSSEDVRRRRSREEEDSHQGGGIADRVSRWWHGHS